MKRGRIESRCVSFQSVKALPPFLRTQCQCIYIWGYGVSTSLLRQRIFFFFIASFLLIHIFPTNIVLILKSPKNLEIIDIYI